MVKEKTQKENWITRNFPWVMMVTAVYGFLASFILVLDKFHILQDPNYSPPCNISPLISCGSVMTTSQAEVFGFPNSLIGVVGFTMLGTIAFALMAGGKFKRWFWLTLQGGMVFGILFIHFLIGASIFALETLCPYCMLAWLAIIPAFWYVTLYNLSTGVFSVSQKYKKYVDFAQKHHFDILFVWLLAIVLTILWKFWYYWSTLI